MKGKLGVIAGSGELPRLIVKEAKKLGYQCAVAAIKGQAEASLEQEKVDFQWFTVRDIQSLISFFKTSGIRQTVLAGKVDHRIIYSLKESSLESFPFLAGKENRGPSALLEAVIDYLGQEGIEVKNPMFLLPSLVCKEGILTKTKHSPSIEKDIAFGWKLAKNMADLDIGQTVVVKNRAVVAVEAMDGTDETIKRAGRLAGSGTVVVKVARTRQDFRIDLPAVGLNTIRTMVEAESTSLCFEAEIMPFFQKEEAIKLADAHHISIVARK